MRWPILADITMEETGETEATRQNLSSDDRTSLPSMLR
jgi:hypothetical protein